MGLRERGQETTQPQVGHRDRERIGGVRRRERIGALAGVALTYLVAFASYACHLHGEEAGSVDRQHNLPGSLWSRPIRIGFGQSSA